MKDKEKKSKSTEMGGGCLVLFALPFAGVGVFMSCLLVMKFVAWRGMQSWEEVPARILHAKLETHRGDDSTTYKAVARYEYEYLGGTYTGEKVSIHGGSDNIGKFHQKAAGELMRYQASGEPFPAWVNPEEPSDSILYRDIRLPMMGFYTLFAVVFGGAGFGMIFFGIKGARRLKKGAKLASAHPVEPWLHREEWAKGMITSSEKSKMIFMMLFALFWCVISAPLLFVLPEEIYEKGNKLALLGLLLPAVGVMLLCSAVRHVVRFRKFGVSTFEMASVPGVIGGKLAGVVHVNQHLEPPGGFHQTLTCLQRVTSGSGKNRTTSERPIWQTERVVTGELMPEDHSKTAVPVLFGIPHDTRESTTGGRDGIKWRLEMTADVPGTDYAVQFDLPVFRTAESSPHFVLDESAIAPFSRPVNPRSELEEAGVSVGTSPRGGRTIRLGRARNRSVAFGVTVFLAIWVLAIVIMVTAKAPVLFPIVFGFFGVLLAIWAANLWFRSREIHANANEIVVESRMLGFSRTRRFLCGDIAGIRSKSNMRVNSRLFYDVVVKTADGKTHTVASDLNGAHLGAHLVEEIRNAAGLNAPSASGNLQGAQD